MLTANHVRMTGLLVLATLIACTNEPAPAEARVDEPSLQAPKCQDMRDAIALRPQLEADWPAGWRLVNARAQEIDHVIQGYVLTWVRREGPNTRTRIDAIAQDVPHARGTCVLWYANERLSRDGILLENADVVYTGFPWETADRRALLRFVWVASPEDELSSLEGRIVNPRAYALEILEGLDVKCRYEASRRFIHLWGVSTFPDDARLVSGGSNCPSVEKLAKNPFLDQFDFY